MNESLNWFTILLNKWLGGATLKLLYALHVAPDDPVHPIPNHIAMEVVVFLIAVLFFLWLRPRISADKPGATQQVMEMLITNPMRVGIRDILQDSVEHEPLRYLNMVGSIAIFVLMSNLISLSPAFASPTGHPTVPLACAILTFLSYNWWGLRHHGPIGYAKTFAGPVWWLSWLLFPVEIISSFARLLSLTVRLWANIFASELIYVVFLGLLMAPSAHFSVTHPALSWVLAVFPAVFPAVFILLHAFVAVVQAFVFTILPAVYIGLATSHDH
ncbi:MAG: F0F1 ATP synthase subunit A [Acidobacteriia bacterium]|nr:F0F1 ATP synthase subunit A [Terriglobia bacterium]